MQAMWISSFVSVLYQCKCNSRSEEELPLECNPSSRTSDLNLHNLARFRWQDFDKFFVRCLPAYFRVATSRRESNPSTITQRMTMAQPARHGAPTIGLPLSANKQVSGQIRCMWQVRMAQRPTRYSLDHSHPLNRHILS